MRPLNKSLCGENVCDMLVTEPLFSDLSTNGVTRVKVLCPIEIYPDSSGDAEGG
jgi:hypothetical protein